MKMRFVLVLALALTLGLTACGPEQTPEPTETVPGIYDLAAVERYPEFTGAVRYRASFGYTGNDQQGYNGWYYKYGTDGEEMSWRNGTFIGDGASMDGAVVTAGKSEAVRVFQAPVEGTAKIYGAVKAAEGATVDAAVRIEVNGIALYTASLARDDTVGLYYEVDTELALGDEVLFILSGDGAKVVWNPTVDFTGEGEEYIHYALLDTDAMVGDVHPYYYDGTLYMYYLARDGQFSSQLLTSDNMVIFEPDELQTTKLNAPGSAYYVLGVIKEGDCFRSFYGDALNVGSSVSTDLHTWSSGIVWDEDTYEKQYAPASNFPAGIRDPYAFYDPDTNKYHIIATGYKAREDYDWSNTEGYDVYLVLFTSESNSLADWEENPVTGQAAYHRSLLHFGDWVNENAGEPECPQMFKIGDRWYVFASMAGRADSDHSVGRLSYWVGDEDIPILDQDWNAKEELYLTGEDLCAAQVVEIEGNYYLFGWITQKNISGGWGGTLNIIRRIGQNEDGTLYTFLDEELVQRLNAGLIAAPSGGPETIGARYGYDSFSEWKAEGSYSRNYVTLTADLGGEAVGLVVSGENDVEMGLRKTANGSYELYLKDAGPDGKVSATYATSLQDGDRAEITCILEGNVAELFVNGRYSMCARASCLLDGGVELSAFSAGSGGKISDFRICKLVSGADFGA